MEPKNILILALVGLVIFAYVKPDMFKNAGDTVTDKINSIVPLNLGSEQTALPSSCPSTYEPVCSISNNFTYINNCTALKNNMTNTLPGVCA